MKHYYWRIVLMGRKLLFISVSMFTKENPLFQTSLALSVLAIGFYLQRRFEPFVNAKTQAELEKARLFVEAVAAGRPREVGRRGSDGGGDGAQRRRSSVSVVAALSAAMRCSTVGGGGGGAFWKKRERTVIASPWRQQCSAVRESSRLEWRRRHSAGAI